MKSEIHQKINDQMRRNQHRIFLSKGIQSYTNPELTDIMNIVRNFKNFNLSNDPHKEHNFGTFMYKGEKLLWRIDTHYPENTPYHKFLVVMKATEY